MSALLWLLGPDVHAYVTAIGSALPALLGVGMYVGSLWTVNALRRRRARALLLP